MQKPRGLIKQFVSVVILACLLVVLCASFGVFSLIKNNQQILKLSESRVSVLSSIDSLIDLQQQILIAHSNPGGNLDKRSIDDLDRAFMSQLKNPELHTKQGSEHQIDAIKTSWQALVRLATNSETHKLAYLNITSRELQSHLKVLRRVTLSEIKKADTATRMNIRYAVGYTIIGSLIGLILGAWVVLRLVKQLNDGLHGLGQAMAITAVGDLSERVSIGGSSELEALSEGFNYMVSELESQNAEIKTSEQNLLSVMNSAPDAIITTDMNGVIHSWNDAAQRLFAYSLNEMFGEPFQSILDPNHQAEFQQILSDYKSDTADAEILIEGPMEVTVRRQDGLHKPIEMSIRSMVLDEHQSLVIVGRDITDRKAAEEKMAFLTQHDNLTHLPNRSLIRELLVQTMERADAAERLVGVIALGINHFSDINDNLGHTLGDGLLVKMSDRINDVLSRRDQFGRIGGDEFCIIVDGMRNVEEAANIAEKIMIKMADQFRLGGHEVYISVSMGISIYPFDDESPEILLKHASAAMYRCKRDDSKTYMFYSDEMNSISNSRVKLTAELQHAMEEEQFVIHYQPQYDVRTKKLVGAEALLRWQHPELGLLLPVHFIQVLEETGLIVAVGRWVLANVCEQVMRWNCSLDEPIRLSINMSARQFKEDSFITAVDAQISALKSQLIDQGLLAGMDSDMHQFLEFELTEGVLMENTEASRKMLYVLKELGIKLSVDDFGTGYSSLSYLQQFPLDSLKIDQSFVRDIGRSQGAELIVHAIIDLAHNLRLNVVGEGVETVQQLEFLHSKGCDEVQGLLFSGALSAEAFDSHLKKARQFVADDEKTLPR